MGWAMTRRRPLLSSWSSALALLPVLALAQPVNKTEHVQQGEILRRGIAAGGGTLVRWTCPTTRANGNAFDCATEVSRFDLEIRRNASAVTVELGAEARTYSIAGDPAGTRYRVRVCDQDEVCSAWSAEKYQF